ncbi:MAG TPA: F0F1 ATP synthase subunit beta, partial [Brevibacterium sp.]|nr:F0F1 ATP synthase subunit beta [Brevibacterium sp.]
MTATVSETTQVQGTAGRISRVIGPVVDIEFPLDSVPQVYNALTAEVALSDGTRTITFEVELHLGNGIIRAVSLQPTDGLVRGQEVIDSGAP